MRKIRSRSFLEDCPDLVAEIFGYWDGKRVGRDMPARRDLDPMELPRHLPDIVLVDVEGLGESGIGIFRYRVVGTRQVTLRGHDPTGRLVAEGFFGPSVEETLECYEIVRRERGFLYDPLEYVTPDDKWRDEYTIFLPLSEDGEAVSQILVYSLKRERSRSSLP